ncbi:MAG: proprotein convertase P-domain-containing protein, partial [Pirellulales bacterium]
SQTQSFASANVPLGIPDTATTTSALTVSGLGAAVADVDISFDITHSYDSDVTAFLISPSGTRRRLFAGVGGANANFTGTTLDDECSPAIGAWPFNDCFGPHESLAAFDGEPADGIWTLELSDTAAYDVGTLNSWSLSITTGQLGEPVYTTDANGYYETGPLADGVYSVGALPPPSWSQTAPAPDPLHHVTVVAGQTVQATFGFSQTCAFDADLDNDGDVDRRDFALLTQSFGRAGSGLAGDINCDGSVGLGDVGEWQNRQTAAPSPAASPAASAVDQALTISRVARRLVASNEINIGGASTTVGEQPLTANRQSSTTRTLRTRRDASHDRAMDDLFPA